MSLYHPDLILNVQDPVISNPVQPVVPPKKPRWKRVLRYVLISTGIFFGFILLAAILIPLLFEDQIKRIFINELNKTLATEVVVNENEIDLSILKNFPDASVVFHHIGIMESVEHSDKKFLEADEISLLFNIMNIIKGKYEIQEIIVSNGYCNLTSDKRGNINYKFWKDTESDSSTEFNIDLQKVVCNNIEFSYRDFKYKQDIILTIHDSELRGNFSSDKYKLFVNGNVLSKRIYISKNNYLVEKETTIDASLDVDVPNKKYTFNKGSVVVDKNKFILDGYMTLAGKNYYDLTVEGDEINMKGLLLLLPGQVSNKISEIQSNGNLDFKTSIKGFSTSSETPFLEISFKVNDATVEHAKFGDELKHVSFDGVYSNGEQHNAQSSYITIKNFKGSQGDEPITFSLDYRNFNNPTIDLKLDGTLPASLLIPFAIPTATNVEGMIGLKNIQVKGNVRSFNYATEMPSGEIQFQDLNFTNNDQKVIIRSGGATVSNNEIILNDLVTDMDGSDLLLNLHVNNWIQTVFPAETKPALIVNGTLTSQKIDLNKFLALFSDPDESGTAKTTEPAAEIPNVGATMLNFSGMITAAVEELTFNKLVFNQISTTLKLSPGMILLQNLNCNTMNGSCSFQTSFREMNDGNLILETTGTISSIDIAQLFDQFENFDQTTLTSKNIKGTLTANIYELTMIWDRDYKLLENSIHNKTDMKIENGELIDYKPLESLSGFVDIKDLKHIVFSTLENEVEINDKWIYIPAMKIESSAMDLFMSGKHSFENDIDYQFKLSLADVLVRKFFAGNKQKENYEEDAEGGVNVYISMTGTVMAPVIKYNKKEVKQKLQESGLEEQKFIDIFKPDPDEKLFKKPDQAVPKKTEETEEIEFIEFDDED